MTNAYTKVKVNVRLCGSIPRVDLSSLMQQEQQQLQGSPNRPQNTDSNSNSLPEIPSSYLFKTKEEDCVAQKLRSHLFTMQQQEQAQQTKEPVRQPQHNFYSQGTTPSRRQSPTYEAPSWAVPASGEARLEVRMKKIPLLYADGHVFYISNSCTNSCFIS